MIVTLILTIFPSCTFTSSNFYSGPPTQPMKPSVSKVTSSSVKLKWPVPDFDGNSPIMSYQVEILQEGFDEWQPIIQQPKNYFVVKTLEANTSYQFRVIAYNDFGGSKPSEPTEMVSTRGRGWLASPIPKKRPLGLKGKDNLITSHVATLIIWSRY